MSLRSLEYKLNFFFFNESREKCIYSFKIFDIKSEGDQLKNPIIQSQQNYNYFERILKLLTFLPRAIHSSDQILHIEFGR